MDVSQLSGAIVNAVELAEQLHFLQTLIDSLVSPIFYKDKNGVYQGCNKAFEAYLGKTKAEIVGKTVHELSPDDLADKYYQMDVDLLVSGGKQAYESSVVYADGSRHDVLFTKSVYYSKSGEVAGIVGIILDISERKELERAYQETQEKLEELVSQRTKELQQINEELKDKIIELERMTESLATSEEKFSKAFKHSADGIGILGLDDERYVDVNDAFVNLFGYEREEIVGHRSVEFGLWLDAQAREDAFHEIRKKESFSGKEAAWRTKSGAVRVGLYSADLIEIKGKRCILFVVHDITERKQAEEALRLAHDELEQQVQQRTQELNDLNKVLQEMSSSDALTSLANRRHFDDFLAKEWRQSQRQKTSLAIIMLDVDFFKAYNDSQGHLAGDECLKQVAKVFKQSLKRPLDFAARYGGEEFIAVLPETDAAGAARLAEVIRAEIEALELRHYASPISKVVTVSLGVAATIPDSESEPRELLVDADRALYQAKQDGRNRVRVVADL
jgi:diguanylate cyclase (GGDEF)-like protein/PAS domain S-box-containing protein